MNQVRWNILIVDNDEASRNLISRRLLSEGYTCVVEGDSESGLEKASNQEFELVLLDINLPGLSGLELLPRIVASHPDTIIIIMAAMDDIRTAVDALKQGAYDYILKPVDANEVVLKVNRALESKNLLQENREYRQRVEQIIDNRVVQLRKYLLEAAEALGIEQIASGKPDTVQDAQRYAKMMFQVRIIESAEDMEESYFQMARTLALIPEAREPYARGHSDRVVLLAHEIAIQLGCSAEMKRQIKFAALLQDIGKIIVPEQILCKQENLTEEEHAQINRHPTASVEIIQHVDYFKDIIPLVESHHEWYDGSAGYPRKLKDKMIPLGARILAVADAYDAMTCHRPHRRSLTPSEAAEVLKKGSGKQWDPVVVDALLRKLGVTAKDSA
jgi:response regulator RpfG family c-di-GMP phosphodiesterase